MEENERTVLVFPQRKACSSNVKGVLDAFVNR